MRKLYISLFSLTIAGISFGQVTLTGADLNGNIGESYDYVQSTYTSPGSAGAGQTWDISTVSTQATGTIDYTSPPGTFPQANLSQDDPTGGASIYWDQSAAGQYIWGMDAGGTVITYSNDMTYFEYPLTMGTNGTDDHLATFTSGGFPFTRAGNTTWDCDGYGTLITPNGTYNDVLRVYLTQIYTDTYSGGTLDYDVQIYIWFKAGIHYPVAGMTTFTTFQGTTQYGTYLTGNVGLNEENNNTFSVFPNPATDFVNVITPANDFEKVLISDISGKVVIQETSSSVNIADLKEGIYLVSVLYKDGTRSKTTKIVKQ